MITAKRCKDKSLHIETDIGVVNITENGGVLNNSTEIHIFDMSSPVKFEVRHFSDKIIDLDKNTKETKMKQAVVYMEEVQKGWQGGYVIRGWKGIKRKEDLPAAYMETYPHFYEEGNIAYLVIEKRYGLYLDGLCLKYGKEVSKQTWNGVYLPAFKKAGERLHQILQKPKIVEFKI